MLRERQFAGVPDIKQTHIFPKQMKLHYVATVELHVTQRRPILTKFEVLEINMICR